MELEQISLDASGFELSNKKTRRRVFLEDMNILVPWAELVGLSQPHAPAGRIGTPISSVEARLLKQRQPWYLSRPLQAAAYCGG